MPSAIDNFVKGDRDTLWRKAILNINSTIQDVIHNLNKSSLKIVLIVNEGGVLEGTISDGDLRRGLLRGLELKSPINSIIFRNPLVVPPVIDRDTVMHLMIANGIQQIPIIDDRQQVVGLHLWDEISAPPSLQNLMVIMAGGKGTRLLPHTELRPKPLVLVAGKPMLEIIIERAKLEGFRHFVLAIHHMGQMIEDHFGDGAHLGVRIDYLREQSPLGTAGALSLLSPIPAEPFVVTNCDVLTDIRYGELLDFHNRHNSFATMAVRLHEWQNPYGVVRTDGVEIVGFEEKPVFRSHVNAGVYAISPEAMSLLSAGVSCDMPVLFERLKSESKRTVAYPMHEPWLDVGRPEDLVHANAEPSSIKARFA